MKLLSLFGGLIFIASAVWAKETSLPDLENELLRNNPQMQALDSNIKAQKATVNSNRGLFLPSVSVHGGYGDENTLSDKEQGYLGYISGTWNLYNGGKDLSEKRISEIHFKIAELEKEQKNRSLTRQLKELFYSVLSHKKTLLLLDEKTQQLKLQRQMVQKKINAGLSSSVDAVEIDMEENHIFTERETLKTELVKLATEIRALIGIEFNEDQISASESFDLSQNPVNVEIGMANNPTLLKQAQLEEISHAKINQTRSDFLPEVNLETSYGRLTPQYGDPVRGTESKVFLLLSWNLFSGFSSYNRMQTATYESEFQKLEKKNTHIELKRDLENLISSRNSFLKLKTYQTQRLDFAKKYYDMTLSEYRRGIKNSGDLETATTSLFETKRKLIELDKDLSITNARIKELI